MSVLIKGMDMPKSCRQCNLMIDCDGCEGYPCYCSVLSKYIGYKEDVHTDNRREDYPLVPVPPPAQAPEPEPDPEERIPVTLNVVMADLADGVTACAKLANEIGAKLFDAAPDECETLQKVLCLSDHLALQVERVWRLQDYLMMISQRLGK